ncbi:uncharacterized protein J5F26_002362 [Ciconia maguari]
MEAAKQLACRFTKFTPLPLFQTVATVSRTKHAVPVCLAWIFLDKSDVAVLDACVGLMGAMTQQYKQAAGSRGGMALFPSAALAPSDVCGFVATGLEYLLGVSWILFKDDSVC